MSLSHHILACSYPTLKLVKAVGRPLRLVSPHSLRILLFHDIPPSDIFLFKEKIQWLSQSWNFITEELFTAMVSGEEPIKGRNLLLTFDDGFASNRVVAEEVLNPLGIRAIFFVVSDFIALEDREEARFFIARHIMRRSNAGQIPDHMSNLRWSDLEALLEQGHTIGGHTRTHVRLSAIDEETELAREIVSSADTLEQRLGVPIEHFAYTFGDLASIHDKALAVARKRFHFIHTGLRGDNARDSSPLALCRDAVTTRDPKALLGAYLEGAADFHYARSRSQLRTKGYSL